MRIKKEILEVQGRVWTINKKGLGLNSCRDGIALTNNSEPKSHDVITRKKKTRAMKGD